MTTRSVAPGVGIALLGLLLFILGDVLAVRSATTLPGIFLALTGLALLIAGSALAMSRTRGNMEEGLRLLLRPGEIIVHKRHATRVSPGPWKPGFLVVTSARLLFMESAAGRSYVLDASARWPLLGLRTRLDTLAGEIIVEGNSHGPPGSAVTPVKFRMKGAWAYHGHIETAVRTAIPDPKTPASAPSSMVARPSVGATPASGEPLPGRARSTSAAPALSASSPDAHAYCPKCGKAREANAAFCGACGVQFVTSG